MREPGGKSHHLRKGRPYYILALIFAVFVSDSGADADTAGPILERDLRGGLMGNFSNHLEPFRRLGDVTTCSSFDFDSNGG